MRNQGHDSSTYVGPETKAELSRILESTSSTGAVISGPIGSAKSALLEAVLGNSLQDSVRLLCSPVLGKSSFGALSPLLIDFGELPNEVNVLRYLSHRFSAQGSADKRYIVVEDAHYLDAASAFVLTQLTQAGRIKLILLAVGSGNLEPVVSSTELGARLGRVALGPLTPTEVAAHSYSQLGHRTSAATNAVVAKVCAGNPLLIRAFLRSAQRQEVLIKANDWFVLSQARVENDANLSGTVSEIQKRLDIADAKALEILALGGAEEVDRLERVSGADLDRLIDTGLVVYGAGARLKISAPIYAQVLRDLVPPGRSVQLWREVSAAGGGHGTQPGSLLWACESGETIEAERFVEGITSANNDLDFHSAWQLSLQAGMLETNPRLALQAARALMGMRRHQNVVSIVERACLQTTDLELLSSLKSLETAASWRSGGSKNEIHALLQIWRRQAEALQNHAPSRAASESDRNRRFMEISELWIDLVERENLGAMPERVQKFRQNCPKGSFEDLMCGDILSRALLSLGYFTEAAETAADTFVAITPLVEDEFAMTYQIMSTVMKSLFAEGEYAKIRKIHHEHTPESPEMYLAHSGMLNFWAAFASIQEGRWGTATDLLEEARAELAVHDPERLHALAESLAAYRNARVAQPLQHGPEAIGPTLAGHSFSEAANRHVALLASAYGHLGRKSQNHGYLAELAVRAREEEWFETEQQLLILLWQHSAGDPVYQEAFERLAVLSRRGQGRNGNAMADAVLMGHDAEFNEFMARADALYFSGETGLGTEMLASALSILVDSRHERQRGVTLRKISERISDLGGTPWGDLVGVVSERTLTGREKEIIGLVAGGLSNKEIARVLTVSQRTVEGHLYRVFSKLGISGREELNRNH